MKSILVNNRGSLDSFYNRMSHILEPLHLTGFDTELDWPFTDIRKRSTGHSTYRDDSNQVIEIALLGYKKKDIDINITDNVLTIKGNNKEVSTLVEKEFSKTYTLADNSKVDKIGATLENGLLKVVIPLIQPKVISKTITVK